MTLKKRFEDFRCFFGKIETELQHADYVGDYDGDIPRGKSHLGFAWVSTNQVFYNF